MLTKLKSLKKHQGFMKYLKNTSWLLGEKILRMSVGLFVGIWVARYLGPEQYGLFSYAQSFVGLFVAFSTLGLDRIIVLELVKNESKRDVLLGTAFILKLIGAVGVLLLLAIAVNFTSNDYYTNILIFIIASAIIFQSFNVVDFYFQSKVMSKYVVYANIISLFISSIIKIVLILNEAQLVAFVWIVLFDSFVLACGFVYFLLKKSKLKIKNLKFNSQTAISLLKVSWPLVLSGVVVSVYMKIDQVMIQEILGSESVGQYAAAVRLSEAWYFIPVMISASLFPAIIDAKKKNKKLYYKRFQNLSDFMVLIAILIAIPVSFFSDWIINVLYGVEYAKASGVLTIHIWAGIFVFMTVVSGKFLTVENMTRKIFVRNLFGLIVNISLNLVVIPKYGLEGAAITTLISWFVAGYLYDFFDKDVYYMFKIKTKSFNIFRVILFLGKKND